MKLSRLVPTKANRKLMLEQEASITPRVQRFFLIVLVIVFVIDIVDLVVGPSVGNAILTLVTGYLVLWSLPVEGAQKVTKANK